MSNRHIKSLVIVFQGAHDNERVRTAGELAKGFLDRFFNKDGEFTWQDEKYGEITSKGPLILTYSNVEIPESRIFWPHDNAKESRANDIVSDPFAIDKALIGIFEDYANNNWGPDRYFLAVERFDPLAILNDPATAFEERVIIVSRSFEQ